MNNYITLSLNRLLGIEKAEKEINAIKKNVIDQISDITKTLKKKEAMQNKLFKRQQLVSSPKQ